MIFFFELGSVNISRQEQGQVVSRGTRHSKGPLRAAGSDGWCPDRLAVRRRVWVDIRVL